MNTENLFYLTVQEFFLEHRSRSPPPCRQPGQEESVRPTGWASAGLACGKNCRMMTEKNRPTHSGQKLPNGIGRKVYIRQGGKGTVSITVITRKRYPSFVDCHALTNKNKPSGKGAEQQRNQNDSRENQRKKKRERETPVAGHKPAESFTPTERLSLDSDKSPTTARPSRRTKSANTSTNCRSGNTWQCANGKKQGTDRPPTVPSQVLPGEMLLAQQVTAHEFAAEASKRVVAHTNTKNNGIGNGS